MPRYIYIYKNRSSVVSAMAGGALLYFCRRSSLNKSGVSAMTGLESAETLL